jgi:hypothetical protein
VNWGIMGSISNNSVNKTWGGVLGELGCKGAYI